MSDRGGPGPAVRLPDRTAPPLRAAARRIGYAAAILLLMFLIVVLDRNGYRDSYDGDVSVLDAFYYTTVSISTTGYGDIVPVTDGARLVTSLVVTPLRVLFLGILVGTAFEVLTQRTRNEFRLNRWRSRLRMHTVVIGYGTKGRAAVSTLLAAGHPRDAFIVVDRQPDHVTEANADGLAGIVGDATRTSVLRQARVADARYVIVAPDRDDAAVLITLTARQLNPRATIAVAIRESENEPLLLQSGASAVITSAEAAGRLLGFAAASPAVSQVIGDLLVHGEGLEIGERPVRPEEVGSPPVSGQDQIIAVVRGGMPLPFDRVGRLSVSDRLVVVRNGPARPDPEPT